MTDNIMESVLKKNKTFFRDCAARYDQGREHFYFHESRRVRQDLQWIGQHKRLLGATVMDVGCGTGFYALMAAEYGIKKAHCLDIDSTFLEITADKLQDIDGAIEVVPHLSDLEAFAGVESADKSEIDLYIYGVCATACARLEGDCRAGPRRESGGMSQHNEHSPAAK